MKLPARKLGLLGFGGLALAGVAIAALFAFAPGDGNDPDRVVGIILKCEAIIDGRAVPFTGEKDCSPRNIRSKRLEITVRTSKGLTYIVEAAPDSRVAIGDAWPP